MTTNLFVIGNVKQLRTGSSFRILLPFFRTFDVLNSAAFNSFHNRVEFGMILEGFRNFRGGLKPPNPLLGTPLINTITSYYDMFPNCAAFTWCGYTTCLLLELNEMLSVVQPVTCS